MKQTYLATGWEFRAKSWEKNIGTTKAEWMPAQVPGQVHVDLVANGVIADPHTGMNEIGAQWVDLQDWTYRTTFNWTADGEHPNQVLKFEGLDTVCDIYFNEEHLAFHDNMFVPLELNVTGKLKEGANELRVEFQSAVNVGNARKDVHHAALGLGDIDRFDDRSFVRKAQYQFGWDWGPRLVSCGIWRPVSLVEFATRIVDVEVGYTWNDDGSVNLTLNTIVEGAQEEVVHNIMFDGLNPIELSDGTHKIEEPPMWSVDFPQLGILMTTAGDELVSSQIGFSNIKLLREADKFGESFEFEVNGEKIWAMGANWIPDSTYPGIIDRARLQDRLTKAKKMGCNMLRVWGGGLYETEEFYEICNEIGMLVWQDFPFACAYYPDDEAWQKVIQHEAEVNVKRIRKHPSLCLWCGNNENLEMFINKWGGPDRSPKRYFGENHYDKVSLLS